MSVNIIYVDTYKEMHVKRDQNNENFNQINQKKKPNNCINTKINIT